LCKLLWKRRLILDNYLQQDPARIVLTIKTFINQVF
jgi:hypothetical protein